MKNKIFARAALSILFLAFILCFSSSAEVIKLKNSREIEGTIVKETKKAVVVDIGGGEATFDRKDILAIKRTKVDDTHKKRKSLLVEKADNINSFYYSYPDDNVESIEFVFKTAADKDMIDGIKKEDYSDAADKLDNMKIVAAYDIAYDRLYVNVIDRPFFEDKKHRDSLDTMAKVDKNMIESFWKAYKPYVTKLIDTRRDIVKSVGSEGSNIIVETLNEERVGKKFVFNAKNELQSMEALDERYKSKRKETPKFEQHGLKYLIKSLESETQQLEAPKPKEPVKKEESALSKPEPKDVKATGAELPKPVISKFEMGYQIEESVEVPKSVKFSFQNTDPALSLPASGSMEFSDVKIVKKSAK